MGGVQEALSRIASEAFMLTSAQHLINAMLAKHEQPAVLSAVMKYETTHRSRQVVNDAMDVVGGAGICRGPSNSLGNGYMSLPIAITVEGANILTRSMIIFGQGLNRAHPNLMQIIKTIEKGDDVEGFKKEVLGFFGHLLSNMGRSIGSAFAPLGSSKGKMLNYYESNLAKQAANFAVCADLALALGGRLKFEEMLSGRFADAFGTLYLGYACLWYYKQNENVEGAKELCDLALANILVQNDAALRGIADNFPIAGIGPLMKIFLGPFKSAGPNDAMRKQASDLITKPSQIRTLLSHGVFVSKNPKDRMNILIKVLPDAVKADEIQARAKKEKRDLTADEKKLIETVNSLVNDIIQVDSFDKLGIEKIAGDDYIRPALKGSRFANLKVKSAQQIKM